MYPKQVSNCTVAKNDPEVQICLHPSSKYWDIKCPNQKLHIEELATYSSSIHWYRFGELIDDHEGSDYK